jgi:hypothetical protein
MALPIRTEFAIDLGFQSSEKSELESYALTPEKIVVWNENFEFVLMGCGGETICSGKLEESLTEDTPWLTRIYCHWFGSYDQDTKIIYLSFDGPDSASLKTCDLKSPQKTTEIWAADLKITTSNIHNFCWVNYNKDSNQCQLAYSGENSKIRYQVISSDGSVQLQHEIDCANPNIFYKEKNWLAVSDNFKFSHNLEINILHNQGVSKQMISLKDDSAITISDFGFISKKYFYLIGIEGEAGESTKNKEIGHTTEAMLVDFTDEKMLYQDNVITEDQIVFLSLVDSAKRGEHEPGFGMPNGFSLVHQPSSSIALCYMDVIITWRFSPVDGRVRVNQNKRELEKKENSWKYLMCMAWDRSLMWGYGKKGSKLTGDLYKFYAK